MNTSRSSAEVLSSMDSLAARLFTITPKSIDRGMKHLESIIKERFEQLDKYGSEWEEKPVCNLHGWFTIVFSHHANTLEGYVDVVNGRCCRATTRYTKIGVESSRDELCGDPYKFNGNLSIRTRLRLSGLIS